MRVNELDAYHVERIRRLGVALDVDRKLKSDILSLRRRHVRGEGCATNEDYRKAVSLLYRSS